MFKNMFKSITLDCGKEFPNSCSISNHNEILIYFSDSGRLLEVFLACMDDEQ